MTERTAMHRSSGRIEVAAPSYPEILLARLLAVVIALGLIYPPNCGAQQLSGGTPQVTNQTSLTLAPGDVIRIAVWQQKEFDCECTIAADGSISHPLYRELKVAGLPLPEVEGRLRSFLSRYLSSPTFEIQPLLRVIVAGEVRQPSFYTVPPGTTVAQAVFRAGGPTDRGKIEAVRLVRGDSSRTLDLTRPEGSASRIEVHSGDQILVGRRRNVLQDVIAPTSSILAALAAVTTVIIQTTTRR